MTPAIDIRDVRKSYGALHALKGVSFAIEQGEFFGLLGPNGAGKSTLISIVAGLVRKDAGSIAVLGCDTVREFRDARRNLGVVPQELVFDPFFSVDEILRIQAGYYGCGRESEAWIDELLDALDLADKRYNKLRQLSGGMKRRVLIAQALVHKPPVLILDEPTAGVDVELRRALWDFTRRLNADGHTIVLTTHYLEEAEALCDRVAILDHGEVRALAPKAELLGRHPYRFLSLKCDGDAALPESIAELVVGGEQGAWELRLDRNRHRIGEVLDAVRGVGLRLVDVQTRDPRLEDVFVEMTGGAQ